jgi:hypothetical protein
MDSLACARKIKAPIAELGSAFMLDPATFARGSELGFAPGFAYYMGGRFGVLGRVPADVVIAVAGFIEPDRVREFWGAALDTADPLVTSTHYFGVAADWGRTHLASVPESDLSELADLSAAVVDAASAIGAPHVMAWRHLPRATDAGGRVAQLAFLLRELRFARHVTAVAAEGVPPLAAIVTGPGGERNARSLGWSPPFADLSAWGPQRSAAEGVTEARFAEDLLTLDAAGRERLAELLVQIAGTSPTVSATSS